MTLQFSRHALLVGLVCSAALTAGTLNIEDRSETGFTIQWNPPSPVLRQVNRADGAFTEVSVAGLENGGELGGPALPQLSQFIAVPAGHDISLEQVEVDSELVGCASPVAYATRPRMHCQAGRQLAPVAADELLYEPADAEVVEISRPSQAGAISLVRLTLTPVRRESKNEIVVAKRIKFRVAYRPLADQEDGFRGALLNQAERNLFKGLVVNPEAIPDAVRGDRRVDLILSPAKYVTALEPFIRYKEAQNREVRLRVVKDKLGTTAIKAIIAKEYSAGVTPSHTLLVGSIDDLAAYKKDDYWSDYAYTLLDSGNLPDLSLGRLPVRSVEELLAMVDKIISRETSPRNDAAMLMLSGEETNWCHVNLAYLREHILGKGLIPLEITKLYSSEGATTDKVMRAFNANPNLVIYDGHGNASGLIEIPFVMKDLDQLKNTTFPLVFDIACLNAYWPKTGATARNFADSMATLKNSGAAGILAATSYAGGHDLFRAIFRASVFDELDAETPYHNLHEVGDAIWFGKLKYLQGAGESAQALNDNEMFYYLGDPASTVFHTPIVPLLEPSQSQREEFPLDTSPEAQE